jgi:AcrR family transcriptional regulator
MTPRRPSDPPPAESAKRADLVGTAAGLFCAHGIHAVGIDRIIEEAGVAKATLYKHFPCKDDLVVAALREASATSRSELLAAARAASPDPRERVLALPGVLLGSTRHGCVFALAAQEFPDRSHPVHKEAVAHKRALRALLGELALEAGDFGDADAAGAEILLVLEGIHAAIALGPAEGKRAAAAATRLLRRFLGE